MPAKTIWNEGRKVFIIDQTLLPHRCEIIEIKTIEQMWEAIKKLRVRGAPAIGIAAAYGVWLGVRDGAENDSPGLLAAIDRACSYLATSRPTAVNLFWALQQVRKAAQTNATLSPGGLRDRLLAEAETILAEDNEACLALGRHGASLLKSGDTVLTHCNAGGLATGQYGTALAPVYYAVERENKSISVYADETRPLLQGARLTAWELMNAGIPVTLICDNMAGVVMRQGKVSCVMVGTDRVARNGDVANKIGTYTVAVLAREHRIPFYVAAPLSSIDVSIPDGNAIPIEERDPSEVTSALGTPLAPKGVTVYNPAFDVTPNQLVAGFITERGLVRPPYSETIPAIVAP